MDLESYIQSNTGLNGSHDTSNVNWSTVKPKPQKVYHGKGEMPLTPGLDMAQQTHPTNSNSNVTENIVYYDQWSTSDSTSSYENQWTSENYADSLSEQFVSPPHDSIPIHYWYQGNQTYPYSNSYHEGNPFSPVYHQGNYGNFCHNQWDLESLNVNQWDPQVHYAHLQYNQNFSEYPVLAQPGPSVQVGYPNQWNPTNSMNFQSKQWGPSLTQNQKEMFPSLDQSHAKNKSTSNQKTPNDTSPHLNQKIQNIWTNANVKQKTKKNHENSNHNQEVPRNSSSHTDNNTEWTNLNQMKRKTFVRTPFLRQKEIDKLKENVTERKEVQIMDIVTKSADCKDDRSSPNFFEIVPNVREVTGGRNTQSNEAIENRMRERRQKMIENENNNLEKSSSSDSYYTLSSDANESFKTAMSFDEMMTFQQSIEKKVNNELSNENKYRKNALIINLLKTAKEVEMFDDDDECESSDSSDGPWIEATSYPTNENNATEGDIEENLNKLVIQDEEEGNATEVDIKENLNKLMIQDKEEDELDENALMRGERLGRFLFQSEEDEDVYVHPLREKIKHDKEWQSVGLSRKGTKVIFSPRNYYLNLPDDDFNFVVPS